MRLDGDVSEMRGTRMRGIRILGTRLWLLLAVRSLRLNSPWVLLSPCGMGGGCHQEARVWSEGRSSSMQLLGGSWGPLFTDHCSLACDKLGGLDFPRAISCTLTSLCLLLAVSKPSKYISPRQKRKMTYSKTQIVHDRLVSNKIISLFLLLLKIKVILILR